MATALVLVGLVSVVAGCGDGGETDDLVDAASTATTAGAASEGRDTPGGAGTDPAEATTTTTSGSSASTPATGPDGPSTTGGGTSPTTVVAPPAAPRPQVSGIIVSEPIIAGSGTSAAPELAVVEVVASGADEASIVLVSGAQRFSKPLQPDGSSWGTALEAADMDDGNLANDVAGPGYTSRTFTLTIVAVGPGGTTEAPAGTLEVRYNWVPEG